MSCSVPRGPFTDSRDERTLPRFYKTLADDRHATYCPNPLPRQIIALRAKALFYIIKEMGYISRTLRGFDTRMNCHAQYYTIDLKGNFAHLSSTVFKLKGLEKLWKSLQDLRIDL